MFEKEAEEIEKEAISPNNAYRKVDKQLHRYFGGNK